MDILFNFKNQVKQIMDYLNLTKTTLNEEQKKIITQCINKKNYGMGISLPMGYGKSLIGLSLCLEYYVKTNKPCLIIVPKTLINNWEHEIKKFFNDKIKYIIFHKDNIKKIDTFILPDDTQIVITTPQVTSKYFKLRDLKVINYKVINYRQFNQHRILEYTLPKNPLLNVKIGGGLLYSIDWGCVIVDEVHKYTNITSNLCRSIVGVYSKNRFVMSGTIFDEPKIEKILGYYMLIYDYKFPNNLKDAEYYVKKGNFNGYKDSMIIRNNNKFFIKPKINKIIINNVLTKEEALVYMSMKKILKIISDQVKIYKKNNDIQNQKIFSSYLLSMITYLRQCVISPILPIANALIETCDIGNKSHLYKFIVDIVNELKLDNWLNDINSVKSSRIKKVLEVINEHKDEKIILFTNYKTIVDLINYYLPKNRNVLTLTSNMNINKRGDVINKFNNSENDILLLTYQIGSEGLNLQSCKTMLLVDLYWNVAKIEQAIARIFRPGQLSKEINVYYFISNTGIENILLQKNKDKIVILNEIKTGKMKSKIKNITARDIFKLIDIDENLSNLTSNLKLN